MKTRLFSTSLVIIFFTGAIPLFFAEPSGSANAGLAAGFVVSFDHVIHIIALLATGIIAARLGKDALIVYPLCTILMLLVGGLMQLTEHQFPALQAFLLGAILLFAFSICTLRNKGHLAAIPFISVWSYYSAYAYMHYIPSITTPLYFLLGMVINAALILAIGISFGLTFNDTFNHYLEKFRTLPAINVFISLF